MASLDRAFARPASQHRNQGIRQSERCHEVDLDAVATAKIQNLALHERGLPRNARKHLTAEGIDIGSDIVGKERPELIVDEILAQYLPEITIDYTEI